jgi:hypothetical protein
MATELSKNAQKKAEKVKLIYFILWTR